MRDGDVILDNAYDIENHVINYFNNLYAFSNSCINNGLVDKGIPSLVSVEDNIMLTNIPSMEEVKSAVFL